MSLFEQFTVASPSIRTVSREWVLSGRVTEGAENRAITLSPLPFQVGRRSGLSLTLPRQTISGLHSEFLDHDGRLVVRDLGSTNGTFVNGERLRDERELQENDLVQFADVPFRLSRIQTGTASHTRCQDACDQALAIVQFDNFCSGNGMVPHFQPICDLATGEPRAYEALMRGRLVGLETPEFMFAVAAQLGASAELSRMCRRVSIQTSNLLGEQPHLFLNTHPSEMDSTEILADCTELRRLAPTQRLTLEIHEGALARQGQFRAVRDKLNELDITLAFDDFGTGQARIAELAEVRPEYLKFDRCMVRQLHAADAARRRVVRGLVSMAQDVGIVTLAEGVETHEERDACIDVGFELVQGFLFGRPMPASHFLAPGR